MHRLSDNLERRNSDNFFAFKAVFDVFDYVCQWAQLCLGFVFHFKEIRWLTTPGEQEPCKGDQPGIRPGWDGKEPALPKNPAS
jgi:hypothetical protein